MKQIKKVLFICVTSQNVITFRLGLIKKIQEKGYEVHVVCFDRKYEKEIVNNNIMFHCVQGSNRGLGVLENLKLKKRYYKIIKEINPSLVFTFMLKPNVFGVLAAKKAHVKSIYSMVEGVGDVYINNNIKWKLIRCIVNLLYKRAFKFSNNIYFLNKDDEFLFRNYNLVKSDQSVLIDGVGVDSKKFSYYPIENKNGGKLIFLMVARLNKTKGVLEYCEAARKLKNKQVDAECWLVGQEGNVRLDDIKEYIDDGSIIYKGTTDNIYEFYKQCSVYVLPSYREGMPMSVLEAMSTGRAIITTNTEGGCRYIVQDGINGFLVKSKDSGDLFDKMLYLLNNRELVYSYGHNSRKLVDEKYNGELVNKKIIENILDERIKILYFIRKMNVGGAESFIMNVLRNIDRSCFAIDFLTEGAGVFDDEIHKLGSKIYNLPYITSVGPLIYKKNLSNFLKRHRYDIVHSHIDQVSGIILEVCKKRKIKCRIAHSHSTKNSNSFLVSQYKKYLQSKINRNATHRFACSKEAGTWLYGEKVGFDIIRNGIDFNRFSYDEKKRIMLREKYEISKDCLVIGHVGRFIDAKNHKFLVEIFEKKLKREKECLLVLVGDGDLKADIMNELEAKGISGKVIMIGQTKEPEKYYNMMDCFVFPSIYEGLPLTLIEAQVNGLPVLMSNNISKECIVMESSKVINLSDGPDCWAENILKRPEKIMKKKNFDLFNICEVVKVLENKYIKMVRHERGD